MANKVIRLTDEEFMSMINEAVADALVEMDGKTAMRVPNVSTHAKNDIYQSSYSTIVHTNKTISNDSLKQKAQNMWPRVDEHWLHQFKGITFKFFGIDGIGLVAHILFTFEKLTHLSSDKTILVGTVTYNNQSINGDGIVINFNKGTVKYKERGNRYQYSLEIDNRTKLKWDALLEQIQMALTAGL